MSLGLGASLLSLIIFLHTHYAHQFAAALLSSADRIQPEPAPSSIAPAVDANAIKYRAIGDYLARRYRVSSEMATEIVTTAYLIGKEFKLDPLLILAVISVESRFNPIAESAMGAKGLMQVIPRFHIDKFGPLGGEKVAFEPQANMLVGAKILKDYIRRAGDVGGALQLYVGASSDENENGYTTKVIAERDRLTQVLRTHKGPSRPLRPLASSAPII